MTQPLPPHPACTTVIGTDRAVTIDGHVFDETEIPVAWFERAMRDRGLPGVVVTGTNASGLRTISRGSLFALAREVGPDGDEDGILSLLVSTLCWGSGRSSRKNNQRLDQFVDAGDRTRHVASLRRAWTLAADGDAHGAYWWLIRGGTGGNIPQLGPSYITKVLYMMGGGALDWAPVILDDRVSRLLSACGVPINAKGPWPASQYRAYVTLMHEWAGEFSKETKRPVGADEVEKALWAAGG